MTQYISETFEDATLAGYTTPGWYFWDETQAGCIGPYESQEVAEKEAQEYFLWINREK